MINKPAKVFKSGKEITVGDFSINQDGVIYNELRDDVEQHIPVCSPLLVKAITRNKDGNDWGKLLVFVDPEGQEKQYHMASSKNQNVIISDLVHPTLTPDQINQIHRLHFVEKWSARKIARHLH